jgi:hypothetical protein
MDRVVNENVWTELRIFSLNPKTQENGTGKNISEEWTEPALLQNVHQNRRGVTKGGVLQMWLEEATPNSWSDGDREALLGRTCTAQNPDAVLRALHLQC